ncbi:MULTISPECIES: antitoxin Xre/MbcA/ParS toxin-binding domain-containing protein [Sulfitobacter]|uniref:Antitoxin Xre/MbcA/ParS toxin-binding domain-containing protein n=1 Tax=Sulfitobacter profundi TaxID=2679961 RepID=A0ABW1YXU7_9RHOB|nr:antitoxin Xre/MbcA/ParS toxin-binding domain-containing protein [Sulfitobacter indolifex]
MHSIDYFNHHGQADPRKVAFILRTSITELAVAAGVDQEELQGPQMMSDETQNRLDNLVDVLNKVGPRFATPVMAYHWYRSEPLAGFDGQTAMQLVQAGKAQQVVEYIEAVGAGIFY